MRRCTVLGASGYIGRHLAERLRSQGWDCRTPSRHDPAVWHEELGVVFYCVGLTSDFRSRPLDTVQAHVGLLHDVLKQARFERLVYLSSTRVYLGAEDTAEDQALRTDAQNPDDLYKLSKLMGESLVLHGGRPGVVARLSNVVGGQGGNPDSFIYSLVAEARQGHILLRTDPESAKDYVHVDDVTLALSQLADGGTHKLYNLAGGAQITHRQWVERLSALTGCTWAVAPAAPRLIQSPIQIDRLSHERGYVPRSRATLLQSALDAALSFSPLSH